MKLLFWITLAFVAFTATQIWAAPTSTSNHELTAVESLEGMDNGLLDRTKRGLGLLIAPVIALGAKLGWFAGAAGAVGAAATTTGAVLVKPVTLVNAAVSTAAIVPVAISESQGDTDQLESKEMQQKQLKLLEELKQLHIQDGVLLPYDLIESQTQQAKEALETYRQQKQEQENRKRRSLEDEGKEKEEEINKGEEEIVKAVDQQGRSSNDRERRFFSYPETSGAGPLAGIAPPNHFPFAPSSLSATPPLLPANHFLKTRDFYNFLANVATVANQLANDLLLANGVPLSSTTEMSSINTTKFKNSLAESARALNDIAVVNGIPHTSTTVSPTINTNQLEITLTESARAINDFLVENGIRLKLPSINTATGRGIGIEVAESQQEGASNVRERRFLGIVPQFPFANSFSEATGTRLLLALVNGIPITLESETPSINTATKPEEKEELQQQSG